MREKEINLILPPWGSLTSVWVPCCTSPLLNCTVCCPHRWQPAKRRSGLTAGGAPPGSEHSRAAEIQISSSLPQNGQTLTNALQHRWAKIVGPGKQIFFSPQRRLWRLSYWWSLQHPMILKRWFHPIINQIETMNKLKTTDKKQMKLMTYYDRIV